MTKEIISEIGRIASESLGNRLLVNSLVKCLDNCGAKGLCNISDSESYYLFIRIGCLISVNLLGNSAEKVASGKFQVITVGSKH